MVFFSCVQHADFSISDQHGVSLDQRISESEAYYSLLQEQVTAISASLNTSEEAKQLSETTKTMMEALRQCIDMVKDTQISGLDTPTSIEPSPPPEVAPPAPVLTEETRVTKQATPAIPVDANTVNSSETSSELRYMYWGAITVRIACRVRGTMCIDLSVRVTVRNTM